MTKYSIIMPLKINNLNSFKIFTEISLPLYNKFLETDNLDQFYIICPKDDIQNISKYTELYPSIPYKFIEENSLLNDSVQNIEGWYKQQIIKLTVALIVNTDYYLVVDSDMYINQSLKYKDLFHNKKLKYSFEEWQTKNDKYYSTNSNWWESSCKILNYPVENIYNDKYLMGVTPQILITEEVIKLLSFLKLKYNNEWQKTIYDMKFTEYTLYWIYLLMNNKKELYTIEGVALWKHDLDRNILYYHTDEEMRDIVNRSIKDNTTHFSVIQSYLPININMIKKVIISKEYDAIFLIASMTHPNRYQAFTREERVEQILDTLKNVKTHVPNSYCILIEGSVLLPEEQIKYKDNYDLVLELGYDESIYPYINHPLNIGHGEMKLLEKGIDYVLDNNVFGKYVFKLTSRYKLTTKFNLNNYKKDKYCFREHFDESINNIVFTTGLYSIPFNRLAEYKRILEEGQDILSKKCPMVERLYVEMIESTHIHLITDLGVEGNLSYNKTYFNK